jgi:hypothetical protein
MMNSFRKRPGPKALMLFAAVIVVQCCCCVIPYSWTAGGEYSIFAAPVRQEQDLYVPPRESMKAGTSGDLLDTGMTYGEAFLPEAYSSVFAWDERD